MSTYDAIVDNYTINVQMSGSPNRATDELDMKSKSSSTMYLLYPNFPLELEEILKPMTVPEQEANRPKCLDGTRVDLLQQIREWASSSDSPNIFLLTGIAGTGKSTIARTVAEEFKTKKSLDVTYSLKGERQIRVRSQALLSGKLLLILRRTAQLSLNLFWRHLSVMDGLTSRLLMSYSKSC